MKLPKRLIPKDFRKVDTNEAERLLKILEKDGNKKGKNYKEMKGEHNDKGELRGRDGVRLVYDKETKELLELFKKTGHQTTDQHM